MPELNVFLFYTWELIKCTKKYIYIFTILKEIQLFWNFIKCISVDVAFLVWLFALVVKTRTISYLFYQYFFLLNWKRLLVRYFFFSWAYFQTKPECEFSSRKIFCMFCFCITLLLGVLSSYAQYDFVGFVSC